MFNDDLESNYKFLISSNFEPVQMLQMFDDKTYEKIIEEWVSSYLGKNYLKVRRLGGPNDFGRDVVGYVDSNSTIWDNYQCKHYSKPLAPSSIWIEIGKICYYSYIKKYNFPRNYYFVSPCGCSNSLIDYLTNNLKLKQGLIDNWDKYCKDKISTEFKIELSDAFLEFINDKIDFNIFKDISPLEFMKQFETTEYYSQRFGKIIKIRPINDITPVEIQENESQYIKKIFEAFESHLTKKIELEDLVNYNNLKDFFNRQRECFYSAEALKAFSREIYPSEYDYFTKLTEEIYETIVELINKEFKDGLERLQEILQEAMKAIIYNNPLKDSLTQQDKKGICHQLANEKNEVKWVK